MELVKKVIFCDVQEYEIKNDSDLGFVTIKQLREFGFRIYRKAKKNEKS